MRGGEGQDLSMNLVAGIHGTERLDGGPHRERQAVRVHAVRDFKYIHLTRKKWELHVERAHEEQLVPGDEVTDVR